MSVSDGQTVDHARRALAARFKTATIDSAELDARLLVGTALGLDLTGLITAAARLVTANEAAQIERLASRRLGGEPVARILGHKEFWGFSFKLSDATLVPRPDTETVVELALDIVRASQPTCIRIADLGTGTGAILLALLSELPHAFGVGTDISFEALLTARQNARDLELADRAVFLATDYASALAGPFDLIVSNPPYIPSADIATLAIEVRDHDPQRALDGGSDGLAAYQALIPQAARLLVPGGALVVEGGAGQTPSIEALMAGAGLVLDRPAKADLGGILRAVSGRKMPR